MRTLIFFLLIHLCTLTSKGQRVALGTTNPHESAALDITSTTGGLLSPRMTVLQRDAIANPAKGLLVFVTNDSSFYYFDGNAGGNLDWNRFFCKCFFRRQI